MAINDHREMNLPPQEFQDLLTRLGGQNKYDEPNFRLWWAQYGYGDGSFRSGGTWTVDEQHFTGYRDMLKGDGSSCWCLGMWYDASCYGTPESYYIQNLDESTGMQLLGEYPYVGRVEIIYSLKWTEMVDDHLVHHAMPLRYSTFDRLIPIITMAKNISWEKTKAAHMALLEKDEQAKLGDIERHLRDNTAPFKGAVSFARQGVRTTEIDKRMLEMQRAWSQITQSARSLPKGISTR